MGLFLTETRAMNLPESLVRIGTGRVLGIPLPVWILTLVVVLTFAWAAFTQALDLEAVFGAFVVGILLGQLPRLPATRRTRRRTPRRSKGPRGQGAKARSSSLPPSTPRLLDSLTPEENPC